VGTGTLTMADGTSIGVTGTDHSLANSITLNGNVTISPPANTLTLNAVVSGPGSLIVNGNLTLNANNTYMGTTTVNAATLTLGSVSPLEGGGELILNSGSVLVPPATSISISNAVTLNGPATLGGTTNFTFGGPITGPGSLTDMNPATVYAGGDSNFSGSIIVTVGTINFGGILGTGSLVLDDGTILFLIGGGDRNPTPIPGSIVFNGHSTIDVNNAPILSGALSGPGGFTFTGGFLDWLILSGTSTY
jgi:autotransporter-associated beta strand protein